jgi:hypothetical protein
MRYIITLFLIATSCGKANSPQENGWTDNTLKKQKSGCESEFFKRRPNSKIDQVKGMCSCLIDEISNKYSYDESNEKASEIAEEMKQNGTIKRCLQENGMLP